LHFSIAALAIRLRHRQGNILLGDQALRLHRRPQQGAERYRAWNFEYR